MTDEKVKPGRVNGKNSGYRSGTHRIPKRCANEIEEVLKANRDSAARNQKKVGSRTQEIRDTGVKGFFSDLFYLKFKLESIYNLKEKHLKAVFGFLEDQGQSPSTIQNKISVMRVFCNWIGKNGMVRDSTLYVKDKKSVSRSTVVKEDKSWEGKGISLVEKLPEIAAKDLVVGILLELCWAFGLRVQEAVLMKPNLAHEGDFIWIREGTKGGRPRVVPIENDVQRDVLQRAKLLADGKTGFLGKRGKTPKQKLRRFYTVMEALGITLSDSGVTAHGLRHEYMQQSFKRLTGIDAPVKGGDLSQLDPMKYRVASMKLMERAGHSRVTIGASYYGSRRIKKLKPEIILRRSLKGMVELSLNTHMPRSSTCL